MASDSQVPFVIKSVETKAIKYFQDLYDQTHCIAQPSHVPTLWKHVKFILLIILLYQSSIA